MFLYLERRLYAFHQLLGSFRLICLKKRKWKIYTLELALNYLNEWKTHQDEADVAFKLNELDNVYKISVKVVLHKL